MEVHGSLDFIPHKWWLIAAWSLGYWCYLQFQSWLFNYSIILSAISLNQYTNLIIEKVQNFVLFFIIWSLYISSLEIKIGNQLIKALATIKHYSLIDWKSKVSLGLVNFFLQIFFGISLLTTKDMQTPLPQFCYCFNERCAESTEKLILGFLFFELWKLI